MDAVTLSLDVLWYVAKDRPLSAMPAAPLQVALRAQLGEMQRLLVRGWRETDALTPASAWHFHPPGLHHAVTVCYPLSPASKAKSNPFVAFSVQNLRQKKPVFSRNLLPCHSLKTGLSQILHLTEAIWRPKACRGHPDTRHCLSASLYS